MATVIVPLTNYLNKKIKGFWNINALAKKYNLYFSRHDVLGSKIIGLDTIKRKLLFLKQRNQKASCCIVDLKEVTSCTVQKTYTSIEAGELKKRKLEEYLHSLSLNLRFKNGRKIVTLPFYEMNSNTIYDIAELEAKAKDWMRLLSKMLLLPVKERA